MAADVVVIGAGAGGIIAAWRAAQLGAKVLLLEKTPRIGTKILISGGGKCNVAHDGQLEDVIRAFRPNEARFIRPACYRFPNDAIMSLFTSRGCDLYTRPDGRVFPRDATAKDVVAILIEYLRGAGVDVRLNAAVTGIHARDGRVVSIGITKGKSAKPTLQAVEGFGAKALLREAFTVQSELGSEWEGNESLPCRHVVLATGGSSYPNSGTTGDGFAWARSLGHTVEKIRPALAPIYLDEADPGLSGVAVRSAVLYGRSQGREFAKAEGDVLFTHKGISGPATLRISRLVAEKLEEAPVEMEIDLIPGRAFEELQSDLRASDGKRRVGSFLQAVVPESVQAKVFERAAVDPSLLLVNVDKRSLNRLIATIKRWPIGGVRTVPLEKGEAVAGGVSLDEVDPQTMRSKIVEGLYLCGEVLDVAGPVGGYNLQAAFATGFVAGESAAKAALG